MWISFNINLWNEFTFFERVSKNSVYHITSSVWLVSSDDLLVPTILLLVWNRTIWIGYTCTYLIPHYTLRFVYRRAVLGDTVKELIRMLIIEIQGISEIKTNKVTLNTVLQCSKRLTHVSFLQKLQSMTCTVGGGWEGEFTVCPEDAVKTCNPPYTDEILFDCSSVRPGK